MTTTTTHPRARQRVVLEHLDRELAGLAAEGLPARYWDDALAGPVREFLARPGKEFRARLVAAGWELGGGDGAPPDALPLIVEVLHAGSLIIDDIEDDSTHRRGAPALHRQIGVPLALNTGNWMYFWPFQLLEGCGLDAATELALHRVMTRTLQRCHQGQALDLAVRVCDVPREDVARLVMTTTLLKTGALMELAATLGVVAAGADPERVHAVGRFGRELGVGLQMLDDLGGLSPSGDAHKRFEDLRHLRATWPWAWIADAGEVEYQSFREAAPRVAAGELPVEPFAHRLRERLGLTGKLAVRQHLGGALAGLERALGPSRALHHLAAEIERLEKAYG